MGQAAPYVRVVQCAECCDGEENLHPLHRAASSGDVATVRRLLDGRASLQSWDVSGAAPLHLAAEHGHLNVVRLLLEGSGDPDIRDASGERPAHRACEVGSVAVLELLLERRAHVEARDIDGRTPAHSAAVVGTLTGSLLGLLLESRADVHTRTRHGESPSDLAAANGHKRVVRSLAGIGQGADVADPLSKLSMGEGFGSGLDWEGGTALPAEASHEDTIETITSIRGVSYDSEAVCRQNVILGGPGELGLPAEP